MINKTLAALAVGTALLTAGAPFARATPVTITFEGFADLSAQGESPSQYYNNGLSQAGFGPGPAWGITFDDNNPAVYSSQPEVGGGGNFSNEPSASNALTWFNAVGSGATFTVAGGFTGPITFYYSSNDPGTLTVSDDIGDTMVLGARVPTNTLGPGGTQLFDTWTFATFTPSGTATTITFDGNPNNTVIDNISFNDPNALPNCEVNCPEPASIGLFTLGLVALGRYRRRRA